jgi:hypothetical protein
MGWNGTILVYSDDSGNQFVGTTLPEGRMIPEARVRRFDASGPRLPMDVPGQMQVDDADVWLEERKEEGFTFEPV